MNFAHYSRPVFYVDIAVVSAVSAFLGVWWRYQECVSVIREAAALGAALGRYYCQQNSLGGYCGGGFFWVGVVKY